MPIPYEAEALAALTEFWVAMRDDAGLTLTQVPEPPYPPIPERYWTAPGEYVETDDSYADARAEMERWVIRVRAWREQRAASARARAGREAALMGLSNAQISPYNP